MWPRAAPMIRHLRTDDGNRPLVTVWPVSHPVGFLLAQSAAGEPPPMFDFAWSEIALIGVVALVLIGPKDMPVAIKAVSDMVRKARKMAGEFQSHVDEMTKDTGLAEVRQQISDIRNMDIGGEIAKAVDGDGSIRAAFNDDPFRNMPPGPTAPPVDGPMIDPVGETPMPEVEVEAHAEHRIESVPVAAPAFIPPSAVPAPPPVQAAPAFVPPAFIPPSAAHASAAPQDAAGV